MLESRSARWPVLLAELALLGLVCGVFFPIVGYEFINLDVLTQLEDGPPVRGLGWENLKEIFTSRHVTSYYPVRTLSFAVDHQIWGLHSGGFKLTNGLIHLASVLLVFRLILRVLKHQEGSKASSGRGWNAAAAAFGAGLFAVHPLVVEPVTWVAGREELLMTLGVLGAIHFHLSARSLEAGGARPTGILACHAGTVLCCAAACLSNVVAAVTPLLVTAWDILAIPRPRSRRILGATAPLWILAVVTIVVKKLDKSHHAETIAEVFSPQWLTAILKLYWTNLAALFWPRDLALSYVWPRPTSFQDAEVMLGAVAVALTFAALWIVRKQPLVLFGLLWFGLALGPTAQILPHHVARADRFLYLPLVGLGIAAGAGAGALGHVLRRCWARAVVLAAAASGMSLLAVMAGVQVRTWQTNATVWENCLRLSPDNDLAHRCLADELAKRGRIDEATAHYKTALRLDLENEMALCNYARMLITCDPQRRDYDLALRLAEFACGVTRGDNPETPRTLAMVYNAQALEATARGECDQAVERYQRAIKADPEYAMAQFNLALLLAMCGDETFRRPQEAVRLARQACRLVGAPSADQWMIRAAVCAQAGLSEEAIRAMENAAESAESAGNRRQARQIRGQLQIYLTQISNEEPKN